MGSVMDLQWSRQYNERTYIRNPSYTLMIKYATISKNESTSSKLKEQTEYSTKKNYN